MRKKKVLVHGTAESLEKFFADAVSRDYEVIAILSEENISFSELEVFTPQSLPKLVYKLIDAIIITDAKGAVVKYFLKQKVAPCKLITYDAAEGWGTISLPDSDGTQVIYFCGLEFHIRNQGDINFFKVIHWQLQTQRQIQNLNPKFYPVIIAKNFQLRMNKPLDFNNLQTFTEKLQWLKIYDATPLKSRLADKYLVRNWVAEKIGEEYLIPLLGVWDNFNEINLDDLPAQFVLKCNHGSGMNIIVRDKKSFDMQRAREKLNAWLAFDYAAASFELHYTRINRKIIAEKFMANGDLPDLIDYKFLCFNGKIVYCQYLTDRSNELRLNYLDENWNVTNVERSDHPENIPPPKNFELMKKLAAKLAQGFAFVRVDFYEVDGKIYFGEMTFTPGAGNFYYKSEGTDEYLGSLLKLPAPTPLPQFVDSVEYRIR